MTTTELETLRAVVRQSIYESINDGEFYVSLREDAPLNLTPEQATILRYVLDGVEP